MALKRPLLSVKSFAGIRHAAEVHPVLPVGGGCEAVVDVRQSGIGRGDGAPADRTRIHCTIWLLGVV